jgi:DNA-binding MarR family transcriptional regulator
MKPSSLGSGDEPDPPLDAAELRDRLHAILRQLDRATGEVSTLSEAPTAKRLAAVLKARRLRAKFFSADLFAEPAWDMLLELYAAELDGIRATIGSLSLGAGVPATTALRWIQVLEEKGLFTRHPDPLDKRRTFVSLTKKGIDAMSAYLAACPSGETLL